LRIVFQGPASRVSITTRYRLLINLYPAWLVIPGLSKERLFLNDESSYIQEVNRVTPGEFNERQARAAFWSRVLGTGTGSLL